MRSRFKVLAARARRRAPDSCPPHFCFLLSRFQILSLLAAPRFQRFSFSVFQLFASWPVEQRALGLLLLGGDFD